MPFAPPPTSAAWFHQDARSGFEVVHLHLVEDGHSLTGATTAVQDGLPWIVGYAIRIDAGWRTRSARVTARSDTGSRTRLLETDGQGRWTVDDKPAPHLDGCLDVDLESSALTNAFPVHRLALATGRTSEAPAVYVRTSLAVERLEQTYTRLDDGGPPPRFRYRAEAFDFECELVYDASGFALRYPGIATRAL